jgi:hypothetical protein
MLRLGLGLMFVGLIAAAEAAQPDEDYFVTKLDLITTQFVHSDTGLLPAFRVGASVVLTHQPEALTIKSGSSSASQLSPSARLQPEIIQTSSINTDRIALPRFLGVAFKGEQVNLTVRSNSALIEVKQFQIILKPNQGFIKWSKAI